MKWFWNTFDSFAVMESGPLSSSEWLSFCVLHRFMATFPLFPTLFLADLIHFFHNPGCETKLRLSAWLILRRCMARLPVIINSTDYQQSPVDNQLFAGASKVNLNCCFAAAPLTEWWKVPVAAANPPIAGPGAAACLATCPCLLHAPPIPPPLLLLLQARGKWGGPPCPFGPC